MTTLKKPLRFQDIPQFMKGAPSRVDLPWQEISRLGSARPGRDLLPTTLLSLKGIPVYFNEVGSILKEKGAYIEYCLQGGFTASNIYFNWNGEQRWQTEIITINETETETEEEHTKPPVWQEYL